MSRTAQRNAAAPTTPISRMTCGKAIEFVTQMNTDIIETTRDMLKQVEYIVCSEIWGWISYQPKIAMYIIQMGGLPTGHDSTDILKVVDPK